MPTPTTAMYTDASHGAVPTSSGESRNMPTIRIAVPAIGNTR